MDMWRRMPSAVLSKSRQHRQELRQSRVLTCFRSSMELITALETSSSTDVLSQNQPFQCGEIISTPTWYINGSQTISTSGGYFTGLASGLYAEWKKSDLSLFTPASAPILGYEHLGGTTTSTRSHSATSLPNGGSQNNSGLSTGAKAGIGVSVGIVFLVLLGVALWYMRRLHQGRQGLLVEMPGEPRAELDPKAETAEAPDYVHRYEADDSVMYAEKRIELEPVELDGNWHGCEMEDTGRKAEKDPPSRSSSIVATPARFLRPDNWL